MSKADEERRALYRAHNQTAFKHNAVPNPHDMQCQCDACRDTRRKEVITVAVDNPGYNGTVNPKDHHFRRK